MCSSVEKVMNPLKEGGICVCEVMKWPPEFGLAVEL
jgi:hypothetical protein